MFRNWVEDANFVLFFLTYLLLDNSKTCTCLDKAGTSQVLIPEVLVSVLPHSSSLSSLLPPLYPLPISSLSTLSTLSNLSPPIFSSSFPSPPLYPFYPLSSYLSLPLSPLSPLSSLSPLSPLFPLFPIPPSLPSFPFFPFPPLSPLFLSLISLLFPPSTFPPLSLSPSPSLPISTLEVDYHICVVCGCSFWPVSLLALKEYLNPPVSFSCFLHKDQLTLFKHCINTTCQEDKTLYSSLLLLKSSCSYQNLFSGHSHLQHFGHWSWLDKCRIYKLHSACW